MFRSYLLKKDFYGLLATEHLSQITRDDDTRLLDAEEMAETTITDYLTTQFEIEKELEKGKNILEYSRKISYPANAHFKYNGNIYKTLTRINGVKQPTNIDYWEETSEYSAPKSEIESYTQRNNYKVGDLVLFAEGVWVCKVEHGYDFDNIQLPGLVAWIKKEFSNWYEGIESEVGDCVYFNGGFYTLVSTPQIVEGEEVVFKNPEISDDWGKIANYDETYNEYENSITEYVVYENEIWRPAMNVNASVLEEKVNITRDDPRNFNIKKHLLRIAVYELHKLISPHNVSEVRVLDYRDSLKWLDQVSRLKINPNIPRKIDEETQKPATSWQVATFSGGLDADNNPYYV